MEGDLDSWLHPALADATQGRRQLSPPSRLTPLPPSRCALRRDKTARQPSHGSRAKADCPSTRAAGSLRTFDVRDVVRHERACRLAEPKLYES